ncbi:MAG: Fibronectin type domain protein [Paenibacillaceae bacterium]|jgi:hypothetical protein|nr:Fibronectin type domain protein [Paenibacillaceae bacterium]
MKRSLSTVAVICLAWLVLLGWPQQEKARASGNPPSQPQHLEALAISASEAFLSWELPADESNIKEYIIYADGVELARSPVNVYRAVYLQPSTAYSFTVAAHGYDNQISQASEADQAITFASSAVKIVDATGGGNYTTIQAALNASKAGQVIEIREGTYGWFRMTASGNTDQAITIRAAEGEQVVIAGTAQMVGNYLWTEGLTFDGKTGETYSNSAAVRIDGVYSSLVNNVIRNYAGAGVTFRTEAQYAYIAGNHISNVSTGMNTSADHLIIENNEIESMNLNGFSGSGDFFRVLGSYHIYRGNYTHGTLEENVGTMHADVFQTYDDNQQFAQHILIENHRHEGWVHQAIMMENDKYGPNGIYCASDWTIRNSTFAGYTTWAIAAGKANGGIPNMRVENNLFIADQASYGVMMVGTGGSGIVRNNILMNHTLASVGALSGAAIDADHNLFYHTPSPSVPGANDIIGLDPQFVDPDHGDYRLKDNSPAINFGQTRELFSRDKEDNFRPAGANWDIGPYEFLGTPAAIPPIITLTNPQPGASYAPDTAVLLTANARDSQYSIDRVEFYINGMKVGEDRELPYTYDYLPPQQGNYTVTASVYNSEGQSALSNPVEFAVSENPYFTGNNEMYRNYSFEQQNNSFLVEFHVIPTANEMNGVIALSSGTVSTYNSMSAILRMNPQGNFDARNGTAYSADVVMPYESGKTYKVIMAVNMPMKTYSVYITPEGGQRQLLAQNYVFRMMSVSNLDHLTTFAENNAFLHTAVNLAPDTDIQVPGQTNPTGIRELLQKTEEFLQGNDASANYSEALTGNLEIAVQALQNYLHLLELADRALTEQQIGELRELTESLQ